MVFTCDVHVKFLLHTSTGQCVGPLAMQGVKGCGKLCQTAKDARDSNNRAPACHTWILEKPAFSKFGLNRVSSLVPNLGQSTVAAHGLCASSNK